MRYTQMVVALALALALASAGVAIAQTAVAFSTITVSSTAVTITAVTTYRTALCTLETAQIRWRYDNTAPTAAVGHVADPGDAIQISGATNIAHFKAIRTGSVDASLSCTFTQ